MIEQDKFASAPNEQLQMLEELMGCDGFGPLIERACWDIERRLAAALAAEADGNDSELGRQAHGISGIALNLGLRLLHQRAQALVVCCKGGRQPEVAQLLRAFQSTVEAALIFLRDYNRSRLPPN